MFNQAYSKEPYLYRDKLLWFRGRNTTVATFNALIEKHDFLSATEILIGGCSSAGLTGVMWANYVKKLFKTPVKIWVINDSGLYIDYINTKTNLHSFRFTL